MKILVQSRPRKSTAAGSEFVLMPSDWDDFSHESSFSLEHHAPGKEPLLIGTVKIIEKSPKKSEDKKVRPRLPRVIETLGEEFVSLGQDEDYYRNLLKMVGRPVAAQVLEALSDISWTPRLAIPFETGTAFRNSLMRFNTAHRARRAGRAIILDQPTYDLAAFKYRVEIPGASAPFRIAVQFDPEDKIPGRIACVIGRNAVGKTQVLASLATDLTQFARRSKKEATKREDRFYGARPLFTRVLAVSYSAFDKFRRSQAVDTGYVYCGLRNEKGVPSTSHLTQEYERSIGRVIEASRTPIWRRSMKRVLDRRDAAFTEMLKKQEDRSVSAVEFLDGLSSGEAILTHLTTALVSWLEPFSLVLFDEPETHLHPNAVANLFNVLTDLLKENDSYALIATHSPIVLQEIPRKRVLVLTRDGSVTTSDTLELESFGESISELTRHVFETDEIENLYKTNFADLADEETVDETLARFDGVLSQNAFAYLLARHARRSRG
jgi:ABC-type cobalamin/Fe3+-siderophores transport system ATPase subunit